MLQPGDKIAIYMEGALHDPSGKMGFGVLRYSPHAVVAVVDRALAGQDARAVTGIPGPDCPIVATLEEAVTLGANVLVIGIAPLGGALPEAWLPIIDRAVGLGLSIVNGLHGRLRPRYQGLQVGQWIWDIRTEPENLPNGTGAAAKMTAKRLLLIGTDMAVGKMTAGLEIQKALLDAGLNAPFVATGQIGMTITGAGVPLDAIRVDFASGAIEREVIQHPEADWIIVEGQGSLAHPSSTATLPLLRGSCPTHLILCARAGQTHLLRAPHIAIPRLDGFIKLYEDLAEVTGTFPRPKTVAIALNTSHLSGAEAKAACEELTADYGLPCWDPVRHGAGPFAELLQRS